MCCDLAIAERKEWLVTNGLGGYASGTIAGLLTRRYHGLLVSATRPPVRRRLLIPKVDETLDYLDQRYALCVNRWSDGTVDPQGYANIESFSLDGTAPVWRFACADAIVEKRLWMPHGANITFLRYSLCRASAPVRLRLKIFLDARDHHGSTRAPDAVLHATLENGVVSGFDGDTLVCRMHCEDAAVQWTLEGVWYYNFDLARERERGLDDRDDHFCAARAFVELPAGQSCIFRFEDAGAPSGTASDWSAFAQREQAVVERAKRFLAPAPVPPWIARLTLAADQFVVDRGAATAVIAGYPWFADWGRDTMISLRGLFLCTGRLQEARDLLSAFAVVLDGGMIPNRFPDDGGAPEYNTADATLWYVLAIRAYVEASGDESLARELAPALRHIIESHDRGTRYGIHRDPRDGLLCAGEPGIQLTWMDAVVNGRVVTARIGKPVEINALWYNALRAASWLLEVAGKPHDDCERLADQAFDGFERFWNERAGYCYDVIDGPQGNEDRLRPNQIFAVSLPEAVMSGARAKAVVDACARHLLTSYGLRTLAPADPLYVGRHVGDPAQRDAAYHQGTAWGWLLGPFALAHYRAYGNAAAAREILAPMADALEDYGIGTLGETFDGDAPFSPNGCIAQAWSVAETLRCWRETQ